MKKFNIEMMLEISRGSNNTYELLLDYDFRYYEEVAELGLYFIKNKKDVEFLDLFESNNVLEFENRKDVYDYIILRTDELLKLGVKFIIIEKY